MDKHSTSHAPSHGDRCSRGSALLMAVFVLFLVSSMGVALLFLSTNEVKMSQAGLRAKEAFFLAEAGIEDARIALWHLNDAESFDDDLATAAGADGTMNLDPTTVRPVYDANGNLTGLTGYGDDVPLVALKTLGDGWYAAFLTNDWVDIDNSLPLTDTNERVMITAVGSGPDRSFEVVQAIVLLRDLLPSAPPATITMLGPTANFLGGDSKVKDYQGDDCGVSGGLSVPVVGLIDDASEANAEVGIELNPDYESGGYSDDLVFANLNDPNEETVITSGFGTLDPTWQDCDAMRQLVENYRFIATTLCTGGTCTLPNDNHMVSSDVVFVDGDLAPPPNWDGIGTLVVTGSFTYNGSADFNGLILVVGAGDFSIGGAGNGVISGGLIIADIAGPDNIYGTGDDCTGPDNGFDTPSYDESGGGNGTTRYCTVDLNAARHSPPYDVIEFLQR